MDRTARWRLACLLFFLTPLTGWAGTDYFAYSYGGIDVTAYGNGAYAVNLARYCLRMDALLTQLLQLSSRERPRVHIYALTQAQMNAFTGRNNGSSYRSGYDSVVLLPASSTGGDYWGAYFGYVAALLNSDRLLGGPDWYRTGVPAVFAETTFEHGKVKLGAVSEGYAVTLTQSARIPMHSFLTMTAQEASDQGERVRAMYYAQAWGLAHEIFVESFRRAEFYKYLELVRHGTAEPEAFKASFAMSYEDLDHELDIAFHQRPRVYIMDAPADPLPTNATALPLSAAQLQGRLALMRVRYQKGPDPLQLASAALATDAGNQDALRALALTQLEQGAYAEALAAVDRLAAAGPTPGAQTDSAQVLAGLAAAVAAGKASLPVDAATLRRRAQEDYRKALAADDGDRRARAGLAQLERAP
jgi:hypothetical protein